MDVICTIGLSKIRRMNTEQYTVKYDHQEMLRREEIVKNNEKERNKKEEEIAAEEKRIIDEQNARINALHIEKQQIKENIIEAKKVLSGKNVKKTLKKKTEAEMKRYSNRILKIDEEINTIKKRQSLNKKA